MLRCPYKVLVLLGNIAVLRRCGLVLQTE